MSIQRPGGLRGFQILSEQVQRVLLDLSEMWAPEEACGLIVRDDPRGEYCKVLCLQNTSREPEKRFELSANNVLSARIKYNHNYVFWHSHPITRPVPSKDDIRLIDLLKVPMIIVSLHPVKQIHGYAFEGKRIVLKGKHI